MILVDMSQVMISNIMVEFGGGKKIEIEEDLVRHMVLNSIRSYRTKFCRDYGELVLCFDGKDSWRKTIFPYYKANRKLSRDKSKINWKHLFEVTNKIRSELIDVFPYKTVMVDRAEADDVIGTLCMEYGSLLNNESTEKILILSGDKDFIQLQNFANVDQYSPVLKKWLVHNNPTQYLKEHIIQGDSGDGVPNVLSSDDCFVMPDKRQNRMTKQKMEKYLNEEEISSEIKRGFLRNESLIDLSYTPASIQAKIKDIYKNKEVSGSRSKLFDYFMKNKLRNLIQDIGDF